MPGTDGDPRSRDVALRCATVATRLILEGRPSKAVTLVADQCQRLPSCARYLETCATFALEECARDGDASEASVALQTSAPILNAFSESSRILGAVGALTLVSGDAESASALLRKALRLDPSDAVVESQLNEAKNSLVSRWHFRMLNDRTRNAAYEEAIKRTVRPGDSVFDVGCGCGLLSYYSKAAGASEVTACDTESIMCRIAESTLHGVNVRRDHSSCLCLPRKVDVIVAEVFDSALLGESALGTFNDVVHRWLLPEGKVIPATAKVYACAIRSDSLARMHRFVPGSLLDNLDADWNNVNLHAKPNGPYDAEDPMVLPDIEYVTAPEVVLNIDFSNRSQLEQLAQYGECNSVEFKTISTGRVDAYMAWFELQMCEGVTLTTDPRDPNRCDAWHCAIYPLKKEQYLEKSSVSIDVICHPDRIELKVDDEDDPKNVPICKTVLKYLNSWQYVNATLAAVGAACVHLVQMFSMDAVTVIDFSPFPIAGLAMIERGAKKLFCSREALDLILLISKPVDVSRIFTFDQFDDDSCQMLIHDCINRKGHVDGRRVADQNKLIMSNLKSGGITIPNCIKMIARLIESKTLVAWNRVDDVNLTRDGGFKPADMLNAYQVSQNSFPPSDCFGKTYLSDEVVVLTNCLESRTCTTVEMKVIRDGVIDAVQCFFKIQLLPDSEEIRMDSADSHVDIVYHLIDPPVSVRIGDTINILCCTDEDADSVKIVLDVEN